MEERRRSLRTDVDEVAFLSYSGASTRCRLVNISSNGAAVEVPDASYIPNRFRMMTEHDRAIYDCRIVWIANNRIGVEFEK